MNKFLYVFFGILAIAGIVFIGQKTIFKPNQKAPYQTAKVERGMIASSISISGQVVATNRMSVATQATGQIKAIFVKDGDVVSVGQKVAEITPDQQAQQKQAQAWSSYLSAKTTLDAAQASLYSLQSDMFSKWKTYTDLATNSTYQNADGSPRNEQRVLPQFTTAQDDWFATEAKYKNQQAVIAQAQAAVTNTWYAYQLLSPNVTAPMEGTVTDITVVPGMMIAGPSDTTTIPSQKIASVVSNNLPVATFSLSEADTPTVKSGQKVTMTLDALPGKSFTGKVIGVNRGGVATSGVTTYPTTVQFDTAPEGLLPNMAVTGNIIVATKDDALLVPSTAIRAQNSQSMVRRLINNQIQDIPVETGLVSESQTEITSGLSQGDTIVIGGLVNTPQSGGSPFNTFRIGGFGGGGALRPGGR